jgi:preprotein translocase subunit SecE
VVIVAVFAFAAYFAVVDAIVGRAIQKLFDTFTK